MLREEWKRLYFYRRSLSLSQISTNELPEVSSMEKKEMTTPKRIQQFISTIIDDLNWEVFQEA